MRDHNFEMKKFNWNLTWQFYDKTCIWSQPTLNYTCSVHSVLLAAITTPSSRITHSIYGSQAYKTQPGDKCVIRMCFHTSSVKITCPCGWTQVTVAPVTQCNWWTCYSVTLASLLAGKTFKSLSSEPSQLQQGCQLLGLFFNLLLHSYDYNMPVDGLLPAN